MAARKRTITKFTLACVVACLLTIAPQPLLSQDLEQLYQQGVAAGKRGDFSEAETIFRQVTKIDPNNFVVYYNLGLAQYSQGELEEAIASYQKAIEINPNNAVAYYNLGLALQNQGELEEAIKQYKLSLEIDPKLITAKNNLREAERLLAIQLNSPLPDIDNTQHLPTVEKE